jgi:hypothetical protein
MLLQLTAGLLVGFILGFLFFFVFTINQHRDRRQGWDRRQCTSGTWVGHDRRHQLNRRLSGIESSEVRP